MVAPRARPGLGIGKRFASAALQLGHQINHLFFYQQAVQAICADIDLPADEPDLVGRLIAFTESNQIPLLYCATAAEKRGYTQVRQGFTLAGLAEFGMRLENTDRVVQF